MDFNFGENLKTLRKATGLTQEQVADFLNVSAQSVSRWETNFTYPDILALPTIASFYKVTVDSLLGADDAANRALKQGYFTKRQSAHHNGDVASAYETSQELYTRFPNDGAVLSGVMTDTYLMGLQSEGEERRRFLDMSISVSERFMKLSDDMEENCRCIKNIAVCYKLLGNERAAIDWLKKLPSIWSSIDTAAFTIFDGQDKIDSIRCGLEAAIWLICRLINAYAENAPLSPDEKQGVLMKIPMLLDCFFENGDYGFYDKILSDANSTLAQLCDDDEKTLGFLEKSAHHARSFDRASAGAHTSLLFRSHPIAPREWTKGTQKTQTETLLESCGSARFDKIRNGERFKALMQP